jgi:hypothetical protein
LLDECCQSSLLNWFIDHNIGVTVGIIVGYVARQDPIIMAMLNCCIQQFPDKYGILIKVGISTYLISADLKSVAEAYIPLKQTDDQIKLLLHGY